MTFKTLAYSFLTNAIILLSKLRDKCLDGPENKGHLCLDRSIPWCHKFGPDVFFMGCCDCGLSHFLVLGHSVTSVRPIDYRYKTRIAGKAWADPDPELAEIVLEKAKECKVVE